MFFQKKQFLFSRNTSKVYYKFKQEEFLIFFLLKRRAKLIHKSQLQFLDTQESTYLQTHTWKKKLQFDSEDDLENRDRDLKFVKKEQNLLGCYYFLSVLWKLMIINYGFIPCTYPPKKCFCVCDMQLLKNFARLVNRF